MIVAMAASAPVRVPCRTIVLTSRYIPANACANSGVLPTSMPNMAETSTTTQQIAAEAIGTFALVFIGVGTAIASHGDYVAIGLAFGLTVLAGAYSFGRISGA